MEQAEFYRAVVSATPLTGRLWSLTLTCGHVEFRTAQGPWTRPERAYCRECAAQALKTEVTTNG